jgi:hypothetical protein
MRIGYCVRAKGSEAMMMTEELEADLSRILSLRDGSADILRNRESTQIEFKRSFNLANLALYSKTMAAYANTGGGYIVFGVENSPRKVVGVNAQRFDSFEPAKMTTFLNAHWSPEIAWELGTVFFAGVSLGFLYIEEHLRKPVIVTANSGNELKEGEIYYRYRGQTAVIKYPELCAIIDARLDEERRAWFQHFNTIAHAGPTNVAVLDTIQGKMFGAGAPFLIDERLLRQIKFIREGHFTESAGAPALKLVGELLTLGQVTTDKVVQTGIHFEDLITTFLADRPIEPQDARSYLIEACHQMSPYAPIYYFVRRAGISNKDAVQALQQEKRGLRSTRKGITDRLSGVRAIKPTGSTEDTRPSQKLTTPQELAVCMGSALSQKAQRTALLSVLESSPSLIASTLPSIPVARLLESVTHLKQPQLKRHSKIVKSILLTLFTTEFDKMTSLMQSTFRKAVAFVDQELNK